MRADKRTRTNFNLMMFVYQTCYKSYKLTARTDSNISLINEVKTTKKMLI